MKIKEVSAGVKLTKNYDSYQASLTAEVDEHEDVEKIGEELMEKASVIIDQKLGNVKKHVKRYLKKDEAEVGAAWLDKKFEDRLSVQDKQTREWRDVNLKDLEEVGDDYREKTSEGTFIFKKIPEEKRTNNKMPVYRIYKVGGKSDEKRKNL